MLQDSRPAWNTAATHQLVAKQALQQASRVCAGAFTGRELGIVACGRHVQFVRPAVGVKGPDGAGAGGAGAGGAGAGGAGGALQLVSAGPALRRTDATQSCSSRRMRAARAGCCALRSAVSLGVARRSYRK